MELAGLKDRNKEENERAKSSANSKEEEIERLLAEWNRLKKENKEKERSRMESENIKDKEIAELRAKLRNHEQINSGILYSVFIIIFCMILIHVVFCYT